MRSTPAFRHDPVKAVLAGPATGSVRWDQEPAVCGYRRLSHENTALNRTIPVPVSASPAVVTGLGVVLASDDGHVRFFNRTLTKAYWERRLDSSVYASLVVDSARQHVIVAATSGLVTCFDLRGGLVWSVKVDTPVFATPTVLPDSDLLVVAAFHSRCLGLALGTGAVVFNRGVPKPWSAAYGGSAAHRDPYASPAATAEGTVILGCAEHALCLAPDGTELWSQDVGRTIKASPAALHDTAQVAICPVDGDCLFLDSRTGALDGHVSLGAKVTGSPAVSGNVLAIGTQRDTVTGIDIHTRQVLWDSPQGAPRSYTSFSVTPDGDFMATSERGNIVCLRRTDGVFLWESSQVLGLSDHEPEMDITPVADPAGNMYCASYSGVVYHFQFRPGDVEEPSCP